MIYDGEHDWELKAWREAVRLSRDLKCPNPIIYIPLAKPLRERYFPAIVRGEPITVSRLPCAEVDFDRRTVRRVEK